MSVYKGIMQGLNEALEHAEGKRELRTTSPHIEPLREYQAEEIKQIRTDLGMTQAFFASFTGMARRGLCTDLAARTLLWTQIKGKILRLRLRMTGTKVRRWNVVGNGLDRSF